MWKNQLSNNNNTFLYWRHGDFTLFFFLFILFFGIAIVIMFFTYNPRLEYPRCVTDWWVLPTGLGFMFLFLFVICKKVE